ncbi:MAG: glycosyltransferase [Nocardioidaceae bacterium]
MSLREPQAAEHRQPTRAHRTLLVASTGGHREELYRLRERLEPPPEACDWATFDDPQSRSLLAGERTFFVPYVPPRGYREAVANLAAARRLLQRGDYDRVVSTGAGIAVPFLLEGRMHGLECHYIESAARALGPSLTGRLLGRLPGVHLYTQYDAWASAHWSYRGSLFDGYRPRPQLVRGQRRLAHRVVVTLGTMRTFGFRRAVERLLAVLPDVVAPGAQVLWQVGATDVSGLGVDAHDLVPADVLRRAVAEADLVVAHAGIGSALMALDQGRCPVLLPRLHEHGEHVDDHQRLIAEALWQRRLAVSADASALTATHLFAAMASMVERTADPAPFRLVSGASVAG